MDTTHRVIFNRVGGYKGMTAMFAAVCVLVGCTVITGSGHSIETSSSSYTGVSNISVSGESQGNIGGEGRTDMVGRQITGIKEYGPLLGALLTGRDRLGDNHTVLPEAGTVSVMNGSLVGVQRVRRAFPVLVPLIAALANLGPVSAGVAAGAAAGLTVGAVGVAIGQAEAAARAELDQDYLDIGSGDYVEYEGEADYSDEDILWQKVND